LKRIAFRGAPAFRTYWICASVSWRAAQEFLDLGSFVVILCELGHHRFLLCRRRVSHFFGSGSMSLVTATDLFHDMAVALFSYLFK
jgi:hypothetical protein